DEHGTINLVVPPPVAERCRHAVRTAGFVLARGRLEHRDGTMNVVVDTVEQLNRPDLPRPKPPTLEPPVGPATGRGPEGRPRPSLAVRSACGISKRGFDGVRDAAMAELAAALPAPHSFGRRAR